MQRTSVNVMTGEVTVVDLTPEEIAALPPPAPPVMPTITRRQLRLALLRLGVTGDQVEAQIAAMPGTPIEREAAMIEWQDATTYERNHPLVVMLGAALGLTEAQIDAAWMGAATL
jgi:hypothetical protein